MDLMGLVGGQELEEPAEIDSYVDHWANWQPPVFHPRYERWPEWDDGWTTYGTVVISPGSEYRWILNPEDQPGYY